MINVKNFFRTWLLMLVIVGCVIGVFALFTLLFIAINSMVGSVGVIILTIIIVTGLGALIAHGVTDNNDPI